MQLPALSVEHLTSWAYINNVEFHGSKIQSHIVDEDGNNKGAGLVATQYHDPSSILLTVPRGLILNKTTIREIARTDKHLQELLDAVGPSFSQNPRLLVMLFLLLQLSSPNADDAGKRIAIPTPLSDYANFLPKDIYLPTMFSAEERELLAGTSLDAALQQKMRRLETEYDQLKVSTADIGWCQDTWWDGTIETLTLRNWMSIDAIYRSRGLDLPDGVGDSMVPVLDMANHAADGRYNARFQLDAEGNAQLAALDETSIRSGEEITIMYGFGGACEMVFSYGFLDAQTRSAREMFLGLNIPDDDPLKRAKTEFAQEAPGVRIYTNKQAQICWESSFVWWACVNEEDGLDFRVLQTIDGAMELRATWKGADIVADEFQKLLMTDPIWDILQLRAVVLIQGQVEQHGIELSLVEDKFDAALKYGAGGPALKTIGVLRDLEMELLSSSYQSLEAEKVHLLQSESVRSYLAQQNPGRIDGAVEDFS